MAVRTAVVGASGYAGGELLRLLLDHPSFSITTLAAGASAGRRVGEVHRNLPSLSGQKFEAVDLGQLADHDLVFLALPHGQSAGIVSGLPPDLPIVDLGADFRLADADAWQTYYGCDHAGTWTYGLPELRGQRVLIEQSRRVANPGCYPTAVTVAAAPLFTAGLVEPSDVVVVAASGTSGAGRKASEGLSGTEVMGSMSAYKVGGAHQHTPEMEQNLSLAAGTNVKVLFTPLLAPMPRGILATITMRAANGATTPDVRKALHETYATERFVHVLPADRWPRTSDVNGSNAAHLQAAFDENSGRVVIVSAIDNLVKGAAGQALQNANIMFGLDEGLGLAADGVAP